ncbi:DNA replication protein RecF [Pseudoalteromonas luteoviolacea CPMOR-2]|uniref:DNA replication and repair protein RecF n=1 Tax=Pseudoalteromonas luteoviolacea DSM 6061 TaxID=1365250 RepID=A0A166YB61_9GAMM|nr:DNA replication/repair protein RecF [Pseudoalteromonas luteoviolacea]KZN42083.1 DNA replication protein RecF [Pseudoalteromonas luteoviolacea DSM 6061]KZN57071.1 DNA replication protein RecF [Pseudoalteromonas luteoviolacea CPMOR-2]MBE0387818.1 DNA replication and repair protein RecF [Pseudoalteromonas luteoviolacea DSM 6061]
MSLTHISLNDFRNIKALSFSPSKDLNLILGQNGSGKTSLLEAIYFLSNGRSFRTNKYKMMIRSDQDKCVVHGKKQLHNLSIPIGISKNQSGETQLRIQGQASRKIAELAQILPVQVITPESYELFFGGPKERRKFLDLGVFHVEHLFYEVWKNFNKVLKQRNALLRTKPTNCVEQIKFWDKQFIDLSEQINIYRKAYISRFEGYFFDKIGGISSVFDGLETRYDAGWKGELSEVLQSQLERDLKLGYTSRGPHKADFNFKIHGHSVEGIMSRGQLKLLLYALKITQNNLIEQETDKQSILLIDDLPSELSSETLECVARLLANCNSQLFISAISSESLTPVVELLEKDIEMFHVEHGRLITN